jgi:hypothetical protein
MDEVPHRTVIDLEATLAQLGNEAMQRKGTIAAALQKPDAILA